MGVSGELNFTNCGTDIRLSMGETWCDIKIGDSMWLIITKEQAKALKKALDKEAI